MPAKKIFAAVLIVLGAAAFASGITQYNECRRPSHCVVGFVKALGGKASFNLNKNLRQEKYLAIGKIVGGVFFFAVGGVFLFKSRK